MNSATDPAVRRRTGPATLLASGVPGTEAKAVDLVLPVGRIADDRHGQHDFVPDPTRLIPVRRRAAAGRRLARRMRMPIRYRTPHRTQIRPENLRQHRDWDRKTPCWRSGWRKPTCCRSPRSARPPTSCGRTSSTAGNCGRKEGARPSSKSEALDTLVLRPRSRQESSLINVLTGTSPHKPASRGFRNGSGYRSRISRT